jgi:hypothetical protein
MNPTDWKTTIAGILGAIAYALVSVLQAGNSLEDWKTYLVPVAIAALGHLAKDAVPPSGGSTGGTGSKLQPLLVLLFVGLFGSGLTSCTVSMSPAGKPVFGIDPVAIASAINAYQAKNGSKNANVIIISPDGKTATEIPRTAADQAELDREARRLGETGN